MRTLKTLCGHRHFVLLTACLLGLLAAAAAAPVLAPYDPVAIDLASVKQPPDNCHLLGTDTLGRDILSRILHGGRITLLIGLSATVLSLGVGLVVGLIAGYCGGVIDAALTMIVDLFLAFPSLLLAIAVSVLLPPGTAATVCALCIAGWASFARLFRGMALSVREGLFIEAARAIGCSPMRIVLRHILPHCLPVALIAASLKAGSFMLAESALSFLGLGIQPPTPAWGSMIGLYRAYLPSAPWMVLFPGCAIAGTVMLWNVWGDMVRDLLDPHLRV